MAVSKSTWVLLAGASVLVAGVLWMPRTPASAPKPPVTEGVALEDIGTDPVDIAVAKVSGENPMEGILALRALAAVASSRSFCPFAEWRSFREWGCAGSRGWWPGSLLQLGTRQIGRGGARARTRGAKPTEQGARGRRGVRTRG